MKRSSGLLYFMMLFAVLALLSFTSAASAVEVQLAGVRLDSPVTDLLVNSGWGEPDGIGPLADLSLARSASASRPAGGAAGARGGPRGRPMAGRGGAGRTAGSPVPGALNRLSGGGAPATLGSTPTAQGGQPAAKGELRGTPGVQYWLYKRNGIRVILGIETSGNIATIVAQGPRSSSVRTRRGISLGDTFSAIFNAYGYPDKYSPVSGGILQVAYPDEDITFTLSNLRVTEITIGEMPAVGAGLGAARAPGAAGATGAGAARRPAAGAGRPAGMRAKPPGGMRGRARR